MIRDITIGQYYPVNSIIHRIDPRVKIVATVAYVISLFAFSGIYCYALMVIGLMFVLRASKVPLGYVMRGLKPVLFLLIFTIVLNMLFVSGEHMIFEWAFIHISLEGIINAAYLSVRLVLLIIGSSLQTFTTTPAQLTDGLEKIFSPLKLLHLPVHEIAMMMSIALRFIPILVEEADKVMKAQQARGADFESGNLIERTKALVPVLVPLFVGAFKRASDLAMAMEARCYRGQEGRSKFKPLKYERRDYFAYAVIVAGVLLLIVVSRYS